MTIIFDLLQHSDQGMLGVVQQNLLSDMAAIEWVLLLVGEVRRRALIRVYAQRNQALLEQWRKGILKAEIDVDVMLAGIVAALLDT